MKCADVLNEQTTLPPDLERAAEEEIFNSTPTEVAVSTESYEEIPFPDDEDAPPPMESEYQPPVFERATEEEIFNSTPTEVVVSTESFEEVPPPDDDDAPPPMELEYPPASERAAEGRNFDYPSGSPTKSSKDKEIREFLKNKKGCLNYKSFSQLYRKALDDIFNPKTTNTALQNFVLDEMQELKYLLTVKKTNKYSDGCKNHVRNVLSTIYHTDNDFRAGTDQLIHNTRKALIHKYDEEQADKYLHQFEQNMWSLHRTNDAHDYIYYFAKTLDDQKYYQLLSAYRDFNKPLNKAIYKGLDKLYDNKDVTELLKDIRYIKKEIAQYISNDEVSNLLCTDVQPVFSQLCHDAEFYDKFDTYKANYHQVFYENYDNQETAEKYCKRLDDNLLNVRRLMRPHYTVVQFAEHLDEYLYGKVARDKKINKLLHKALFNRLGSSLTDVSNSVLAQFVRQELEQMQSDGNRQHTANILKMLYDTDNDFRNTMDVHTNTIYAQLKEKLGVDDAMQLIEQHKQNLFTADSKLPVNFLISKYADNLSESYYQQITYENRNVFSDLNHIISDRLRNCWENPQIVDAAFILHQLLNADEKKAAEIEKATTSLLKLIYDKPLDDEIEKTVTLMTEKFSQHCDPNMALELEERLRSAIHLGDSNSPVNYRIQSFCKNIKEEYYRKVIRDKKINKPLNKALFQSLNFTLTDISKYPLSQNIRLELELMQTGDNPHHTANILKMLYETNSEFKNALDAHTNIIYEQLKEKLGVDDAMQLIEQHTLNIFSADSKLPMNFLISKYVENLSESYYQQITYENRNVFSDLNRIASDRLRNCWDNKKIVKAAYELNQLYNTEETNAAEIEKATANLFKLIYDEPLKQEIEKAVAEMTKKFKEHCTDPNMALELEERLRSDIHLGDSSSSVNFIIQSFCKNIKEECYLKITMDKEMNKPLNKALFRCLNSALTSDNKEFLPHYIRQELDLLHDDGNRQHTANILKMLYDTDKDFANTIDEHTNTVYTKLKVELGTEDALQLIEQHKQNLFTADSKLPVNFLISKYAKILSESYYQQITHEYREVFACVNQTISKRLHNCWDNKKIVEAAYKLNQLFNTEETNAAEIEKATANLFKLIYDKPLEDELEKAVAKMTKRVKEHCTDPNMALELEERLRSDIYLGDSSSSVNFIIQSFGKNVKEEHTKAIFREMPELKEYRSQLYRHLSGALVTGNQQILQLFSAYQMDARGVAQLDEILKVLSCKDFDFVAEKEKLYQSFLSQLQKQDVPCPAGEYKQIFEKLFYRKENNKYDTMHIREIVEDVIQNKSEILHQYRTMRCRQLAKALFHDLARILNGQNQNMGRYAEHNQRASFKAQKQFKNRKQFVAQSFDRDDTISY